jgi:type IV secretory pathway TraG/TraD family ATPase VirD4
MSNSVPKTQQEMSWHQFFSTLVMLGLGGLLIWSTKNGIDPEQMLANILHFLIFLLAVSIPVAVIAKFAVKHVKSALSVRGRGLLPFLESENGILVAETTDERNLFLPEQLRTGHVQIIGSTGRGKTESVILPMIVRDLFRGNSPILIDGKGDRSLADKVKARFQGKVTVFDMNGPKESIVTNPLKNGTPLQITDRLFAAFDFDDPYYRNVQHRICLDAVKSIFEAHEVPTFKRIYELLTDDGKMTEVLQKIQTESLKKDMTRFLSQSRNDREEKLSGLLSQLAPLATSEIAPYINGSCAEVGTYCYSLSDFLLQRPLKTEAYIVLLPTLKYQKIAHQLGKIFCQEIGWAISEREHLRDDLKDFLPLYMDEFSAFVYPGFADILNKARSSNVGFHLSHQGMGDLERVSPEFANMVNTNTNLKFLLGLNDPDTADYYARHIGTVTTQKLTGRAQSSGFGGVKETGEYSKRDAEEYVIHPNELKKFTRGKGIIHVPGHFTERVQFCRMN